MRRVAVFVDAGYFWVQAVKIAQGEKMGRESITLDYPVLRNTLLQETKTLSRKPVSSESIGMMVPTGRMGSPGSTRLLRSLMTSS